MCYPTLELAGRTRRSQPWRNHGLPAARRAHMRAFSLRAQSATGKRPSTVTSWSCNMVPTVRCRRYSALSRHRAVRGWDHSGSTAGLTTSRRLRQAVRIDG